MSDKNICQHSKKSHFYFQRIISLFSSKKFEFEDTNIWKFCSQRVILKLEHASSHVWFGFVTPDLMKNNGWYLKNTFFSTYDGAIYVNNKSISAIQNSNQGKGKEGDMLTFIIDMDQQKFSVQINGIEVNSAGVSLKDNIYFPYCGANLKECKLSLV